MKNIQRMIKEKKKAKKNITNSVPVQVFPAHSTDISNHTNIFPPARLLDTVENIKMKKKV
jgi:hypothetical protein